ncbi:MAG TPA: ethanolamine utilization protein EutN [Clostridiales bacterium]|nr:ethanolamine utilization protein EutN [Clostridiales bacterium]
MIIGKVVGKLWSTRKNDKLNGQKFLIVKLMSEENRFLNELFVAVDIIGAGTGDLVIIVKGGAARIAINDQTVPIDATIVGIVDSIEVEHE